MGIIQLATTWKKRGLDVRIQDLNGDKEWRDTVKRIANESDYFGISSTSTQFRYAYEIMKMVKVANKKAEVIIGGAHASAISMLRKKGITDRNTETLGEFDKVVSGDGENLRIGRDRWIETDLIKVEEQEIPDRSMMDIRSYHYQLAGRNATTIMTQRGCPFKCEYCSGRDIPMYKTPRQRDPQQVVDEMDQLNRDYGYNAFMWFDDEVNINPGRLEKLCNLLKEKDYKHRGFVRSDLLARNPPTLEMMAKAGFVELCSGIESGSDRILKLIGKGTTDQTNRIVAKMIQEKGIRYKAFTIIGHPSETYGDAMMTKRFIQEVRPDSFDVTIMMPFPGSKMYDEAKPSTKFPGFRFEYKGLYFNRPDFSREDTFYKGTGIHPCHTRTDELTSQDIGKLREELLKCL